MQISGEVKGVTAKSAVKEGLYSATIAFKIETDYSHELFDAARDLKDLACVVKLAANLALGAELQGVSARANVLVLAFEAPFAPPIFKSVGQKQGGTIEEITIEASQPHMFEGTGEQARARG